MDKAVARLQRHRVTHDLQLAVLMFDGGVRAAPGWVVAGDGAAGRRLDSVSTRCCVVENRWLEGPDYGERLGVHEHPTSRRLGAGVRHALDLRSRFASDLFDRLGR